MQPDTQIDPTYGYTAHLGGVSFEEARTRTTEALKQQGFGILTEIDVKATLKAKAGSGLSAVRDSRRVQPTARASGAAG